MSDLLVYSHTHNITFLYVYIYTHYTLYFLILEADMKGFHDSYMLLIMEGILQPQLLLARSM